MKINAKLQASCEDAIQRWVDRTCEEYFWPDAVMGHDTVSLMAQSAIAILEAIADAERYAKAEGFWPKE